MVAPQVVIMTTCGATCEDKVGVMMALFSMQAGPTPVIAE